MVVGKYEKFKENVGGLYKSRCLYIAWKAREDESMAKDADEE